MGTLFDTGHVAQLHEIQKSRLRRNQPGIGPEVEALIRQLTDGGVAGKTNDIREAQAKRFWDRGAWNKPSNLGRGFMGGYADYLATIPEIPAELLKDDAEFPLIVLVEPRLGLKWLCAMAGLEFEGDDDFYQPYDDQVIFRDYVNPTWVRVQDGRRNHGRDASQCRRSFSKYEVALTALEGVCTYLQHPSVVSDVTRPHGHIMELAGSIRHRNYTAIIGVWNRKRKLTYTFRGNDLPYCGVASRRVCD